MVKTNEHLMLEYWVDISPGQTSISKFRISRAVIQRGVTCEEQAKGEQAEKVGQQNVGLVDVPGMVDDGIYKIVVIFFPFPLLALF